MLGSDILNEVKTWEGTPYKWRAKLKGLGADCGSFPHAVLSEFYDMPPMPEKYQQNWITEPGVQYHEDYFETCGEWLDEPQAGCLVLFKFGHQFCHLGFVDEQGYVWHCWGRMGFAGVSRTPFTFFKFQGRMREHKFLKIRDELLRETV